MSTFSEERGILYIATNEEFTREALHSVLTVREYMPEIPCALISPYEPSQNVFDIYIKPEETFDSFKDKPTLISESPFGKTIYLDTDIYACGDFSELFNLLSEVDIAAAHNSKQYGLSEYGVTTTREIPECFPEFNTGVICFDTSNISDFHKLWLKEYQRDKEICGTDPPDQPSFQRAMYYSDIRFTVLPRTYNCVFRRPDYLQDKVKLLHGRLTEVNGMGAGKSISPEYAERILNENHSPRLYDRKGRLLRVVKYDQNKMSYFISLLREYGIQTAIKDARNYLRRQFGKKFS